MVGATCTCTFLRHTVDLEIFALQNFRMINFHVEHFFVGMTLYHISIDSVHAFS